MKSCRTLIAASCIFFSISESLNADQFTMGEIGGPFGTSPTNHDILNMPLAANNVEVKIYAVCDLGCAPCDSGNGCNTDPTTKYITVTMGQIGDPHSITGTQTYVNPSGSHPSSPAVPDDGRFFKCWCGNSTPNSCSSTGGCNDSQYAHLGRTFCGGQEGFGQGNFHYFYIDRDTYNGWLSTSGNTIRVALFGTANMQNVRNYCQSVCGVTYSFDSISQVTLTYTPAPLGSCCIASTGECLTKTESQCDILGGDWTQGGACVPNQCPQPPMGGCCFASGVCYQIRSVDCSTQGGSFLGNGTICEPNLCTQPPVIHVDADATGTGSGLTWADACTTLQSALTAAVENSGGEQIWVAGGTYKPSVPTGSDATFQLLPDVAIYGGFAGDETTLEERSIAANPTILSGDIGTPNVASDNAYHVVTGSLATAQVGRSALLDGFVIYAGNADGADLTAVGGGLLIVQGNPTIRNCAFVGNRAKDAGGGVYCSSSTSTFVNCTFSGNDAYGTVAEAGGLRSSGSNLTLTNCSFTANHATQTGGGVHHNIGTLAVSNCIFWNNTRGSSTPMTDSAAQIQIGLGTAIVQYTDVQGSFTGTGNINSNPLFVDADGDDNTVGTLDDNLRLMRVMVKFR